MKTCWQTGDIDNALYTIFKFIERGHTAEGQSKRGFLVGLYDEPTAKGNVKRWFNAERLAAMLGKENNDWLKETVAKCQSSFHRKDTNFGIQNYLVWYGENKKRIWSRSIIGKV